MAGSAFNRSLVVHRTGDLSTSTLIAMFLSPNEENAGRENGELGLKRVKKQDIDLGLLKVIDQGAR